ncbi:MAG: uracil phosphoribosyltransferase [Bacteroidia bacterium]
MPQHIKNIGIGNSYVSQIIYELRQKDVQQDRMRFRRNMEKLGAILAYHVSMELTYQTEVTETVLGELEMNVLQEQPVIVSILRAGIPLHNAFLDFFDNADNAFISAYRHHTRGNEFIIKLDYMASPELGERDIILIDPMIATGSSICLCYKALTEMGIPRNIYIVGVIASEEGLENVRRKIPNAKIFVAAIDAELTAKAYIIPGLGDAGDLAFGPKGVLSEEVD